MLLPLLQVGVVQFSNDTRVEVPLAALDKPAFDAALQNMVRRRCLGVRWRAGALGGVPLRARVAVPCCLRALRANRLCVWCLRRHNRITQARLNGGTNVAAAVAKAGALLKAEEASAAPGMRRVLVLLTGALRRPVPWYAARGGAAAAAAAACLARRR